MNLQELEKIHTAHRKELELRLANHLENLNNLDRMAQECFKTIDKRAADDRDAYAKVFMKLSENEEATVNILRQELGLTKEMIPEPVKVEYQEVVKWENNKQEEEMAPTIPQFKKGRR